MSTRSACGCGWLDIWLKLAQSSSTALWHTNLLQVLSCFQAVREAKQSSTCEGDAQGHHIHKLHNRQ